jgi:hypothetical protein
MVEKDIEKRPDLGKVRRKIESFSTLF